MNKNKVRGLKWNQKKLRKSILHFTQNKNSQKVNITHQRLKTPPKKKKNGEILVWKMKIFVWIYELLSLKQKQANYNWEPKPSSLE